MDVKIKKFQISMDVGSSGIEFQVNDPNGAQRGDLYITKSSLIWCKGQTTRPKGKKISWENFITWADQQQ